MKNCEMGFWVRMYTIFNERVTDDVAGYIYCFNERAKNSLDDNYGERKCLKLSLCYILARIVNTK